MLQSWLFFSEDETTGKRDSAGQASDDDAQADTDDGSGVVVSGRIFADVNFF